MGSALRLHRPEQGDTWRGRVGPGSSPGQGPRANLHLGSISWLGGGGGVLLAKLCLLIPHIPLTRPCRERTLLVLAHTPNSLRHTSHLVSQLGVPGLSWATTQLLWLLREPSEKFRRERDKGIRGHRMSPVENSSSLPLPTSIRGPVYVHWTPEALHVGSR